SRLPRAAGSATLVRPMIRSWPLPGFAQRCSTRSRGVASAIMRENVLLGPAGEVEQGAGWKEVEARLGQRSAVLACEPLVELDLELVKIADVACRIFALRVAQRGRAPVAGLLLLGEIDVEQLLDQILQPIAVGIGAHQTRGGAGAIDRRQ